MGVVDDELKEVVHGLRDVMKMVDSDVKKVLHSFTRIDVIRFK